jgi:predicted membrane-bound dolichyl-phosphate-mannose-protein mannosyltransferase
LLLVLFAGQGPAVASALLAVFNQMLFVQSRIAMQDIFALTFGLFGIAGFMQGFRKPRSQLWFALRAQVSASGGDARRKAVAAAPMC